MATNGHGPSRFRALSTSRSPAVRCPFEISRSGMSLGLWRVPMEISGGWKPRYTVLAVLFISWVVSFMDRMVMSVAIPYISADFKLSPVSMGVVLSAFFASYSISQIPGGILADIFGVRRVAVFSMLWWSAFTAVTGAVSSLSQMLAARFAFGLGEGLYPACVFKAIAVWFPKAERATANGIRFAAGPFGTALSPLIVVAIMSHWGWRAVFYSLFLPGLAVALLVWSFVKDNPRAADDTEMATADEAPISRNLPSEQPADAGWRGVIKDPLVLRYFLALFLFDIAYWGFTTWLPTYLVRERGFSMEQMGVAASLPFFAGTAACVLGGWLSDRVFKERRRLPILAAQMISATLLCGMVWTTSTAWLICFQTAAGFTLNLFFTSFWALPMNTVRKEVMGIASGIINMAGQIAAFVSPICVGSLVQMSGGHFTTTFLFLIAAVLSSAIAILTLPRNVGRRSDR